MLRLSVGALIKISESLIVSQLSRGSGDAIPLGLEGGLRG
jgi:hypothetical protein